MLEPNETAHLLSDLLKKIDEKKPEKETLAQVNSSFCLKKNKIAEFTQSLSAMRTKLSGLAEGSFVAPLLRMTGVGEVAHTAQPKSVEKAVFVKPKKVAAFTLAEVLITLGIIGVVAAMTIPTVINATNGAQYKTAFKKALSVMAQAVEMNKALNDYDLSQTIAGTNPAVGANGTVLDGEAQTLYSIFRNRLNVVRVANGKDFNMKPGDPNYYPVISFKDRIELYEIIYPNLCADSNKGCPNKFVTITPGNATTAGSSESPWSENSTFLFLNDGITLIFDNTQGACHQATANSGINFCYGFIDVNGQKGPNKVVECDEGSYTGNDKAIYDYAKWYDIVSCTVSNPTDIYPIGMYNETIVPLSTAAKAVLFSK